MKSNKTSRIANFLEEIGEIPGTCAYRGQRNAQWLLHSSAIRRLSRFTKDPFFVNSGSFAEAYRSYHRDELLEPSRNAGFGIEEGREVSDLELLAKLQHFGAATGLLDFTWDPLVALWFACQKDREQECPGKVFAVNLGDQQEFRRISFQSDADKLSFERLFSLRKGNLPLYWEPMANSSALARTIAQRSVFVIGVPIIPRHAVNEIRINFEDKQAILKELAEKSGIGGTSLFRDVHGFSRFNNDKESIRRMHNPAAYLTRGNWSYQEQEYSEALESYQRALQLAGDTGQIFLLIANAHAAMRDHSEAIKYYEDAKQCDRMFLDGASATSSRTRTFNRTLLFNRANSRAVSHDFEGAVSDLCKAVAFCPNAYWRVRVIFNRANIRVRMHQLPAALSDYQKVISSGGRGPDVPFANAQFNMGNVLVMLGRLEDARESYRESLNSSKPNSQAEANITSLEQVIQRAPEGEIASIATRPDPSTKKPIDQVIFRIPHSCQPSESFPFDGFVGNIGNTGGMDPLNEINLPGGEGLDGTSGFAVTLS